jgi:hypothetical protein
LPEWAAQAAISVPGLARGGADVTFVAGGATLPHEQTRGGPDARDKRGTAER